MSRKPVAESVSNAEDGTVIQSDSGRCTVALEATVTFYQPAPESFTSAAVTNSKSASSGSSMLASSPTPGAILSTYRQHYNANKVSSSTFSLA